VKKTRLPPPSKASLEIELARRRCCHHLHDARRILYDVIHEIDRPETRNVWQIAIGDIQALERQLTDLTL
jgi:hypothetical protein